MGGNKNPTFIGKVLSGQDADGAILKRPLFAAFSVNVDVKLTAGIKCRGKWGGEMGGGYKTPKSARGTCRLWISMVMRATSLFRSILVSWPLTMSDILFR